MAKTPPKPSPKEETQINAEINEGGPPTPEQMTDLTPRTVHAPKAELPKKKKSRG